MPAKPEANKGKKGYSLSAKIITVIFVSTLFCVILVGWLVYNSGKAELVLGIKDSLERIVSTASVFIDGDLHDSITSSDSDGYRTIIRTLRTIQEKNGLRAALSTLKRSEKLNQVETVITTEPITLIGAIYKMRDEMRLAFDKGITTSTDLYDASGGIWISAFAPIRNKAGKVVALLKAQQDAGSIGENLAARLITVLFFCCMAFFIGLLLSVFLTKNITANIERLNRAAAALGNGDYNTPIDIESRDEIGQLAHTLDNMRVSLNDSIEKMRELWLKEKKAHLESILTLSKAIEIRDPYTRGHVERVSHYSMLIAKKLGLDDDQLEQLKYGCMLHDLGKLDINISILDKPTSLDYEERAQVMMHTIFGAEILGGIKFLNAAREISLYHHERYDGKGYPFGLKGDKIPLLARIVSIADSFDAMVTDRPYRKRLTSDEAFAIMAAEAGKQFDPHICYVFLELKNEILLIRERSDSGQDKQA